MHSAGSESALAIWQQVETTADENWVCNQSSKDAPLPATAIETPDLTDEPRPFGSGNVLIYPLAHRLDKRSESWTVKEDH